MLGGAAMGYVGRRSGGGAGGVDDGGEEGLVASLAQIGGHVLVAWSSHVPSVYSDCGCEDGC